MSSDVEPYYIVEEVLMSSWDDAYVSALRLGGRAESCAEGCDEGGLDGRVDGFRRGQALFVLLALERRDLPVSAEARERIVQCREVDTLFGWLDRALKVDAAEDLFGDGI